MWCRSTRRSAAEEKGGRWWRGISRRERDAIRARLERFEKAPFIERGLFVDTIFPQNKWWGAVKRKKKKLWATNMHIHTGSEISFHGGGSQCFFLLFLPTSHLLIPKSHSRKNGGERKIVYFVKRYPFRAEDFAVRRLCVSSILLFRSAVPVFKSPPPPHQVSSGHITKTNTVWQRAGSLCSYEAQNLMSMNNEYHSTCWWLSRLPVIRSMKALLSSLRSLSRWIMDVTRLDRMEITSSSSSFFFCPAPLLMWWISRWWWTCCTTLHLTYLMVYAMLYTRWVLSVSQSSSVTLCVMNEMKWS